MKKTIGNIIIETGSPNTSSVYVHIGKQYNCFVFKEFCITSMDELLDLEHAVKVLLRENKGKD